MHQHQHHRHRQPVAGERFRHRHQVRHDAHRLEAEEAAGAATAGLHVLHDQQRAVLAGEAGDALDPADRCGVETPFALDGFQQDRRRGTDAARRVVQYPGEQGGGVDAGDLAGQLHRRLDRVGAGRAGELDAVRQLAGLQDGGLEGVEEGALGGGVQVQPHCQTVRADVPQQRGRPIRGAGRSCGR
jgi:hypothetical protein